MPSVALDFPASPARAFSVLSEPRSFGSWVVGAHEVLRADAGWPAPGTTFVHEQGVPPLTIRDTTTSLACEPQRRLLMEARVRPLLVAHVELRLEPTADGTRVTMTETPVGGVLAPILRRPRLHGLLRARNLEALRRLRELCD